MTVHPVGCAMMMPPCICALEILLCSHPLMFPAATVLSRTGVQKDEHTILGNLYEWLHLLP